MKKYLILGFISFFVGVMLVPIIPIRKMCESGVLDLTVIYGFDQNQHQNKEMIGFILWQRLKFEFFMIGSILNPLRKWTMVIACMILCFTLGMVMGVCVTLWGFLYFFLPIVSWFPQGIFYFVSIILVMKIVEPKRKRRSNYRLLLLASFVLVLFVIGIITEIYIGLPLLKSFVHVCNIVN